MARIKPNAALSKKLSNLAIGGAISLFLLSWWQPAMSINSSEEKLCNAGWALMEKGKLVEAEKLFLQGEAVGSKSCYGHCPNSLDHLAELYTKRGDIARADEYFKKAIQVESKEFHDGKLASFEMYSEYADLYLTKDDAKSMQRAAEILNDATNSWNEEFKQGKPSSSNSVAFANQLCTLTNWYLQNKQPAKASAPAAMAARVGENMDASKYYPLIRSGYFHTLAKAQAANRQLPAAEQSLTRALSMRESIFNEKDFEIAELMNTKYDLLIAQGKTKEAKQIAQDVFGMWPRESFNSEKWNNLIRGASTKAENSGGSEDRDKSAVEAVEEANKLAKANPKDVRYAESLARVAINFLSHGHYEKCEPEIKKAVASIKSSLGPSNPHAADFFELWADKLGKYSSTSSDDAIYVYNQALAIREANLATQKKEAFASAKAVAGYARDLYSHHSDQDELALLERATQLLVKAGGLADNTVTDAIADLLQFIDKPYSDQASQKKAKLLYEQLLIGEKDLLGPDDPDVKLYAKRYATLLRRMGLAADAARVEQQYNIKASTTSASSAARR